ncbi:restriction endonuclease subunit S [Rheinheimera sp. WS51]|uniref:restriction endonuclease subunit S n=1 Tax=Rheinheimera sp. WS51 TaxID=3425886 RepID=UPI003D8C7229
MHTEMKMLVEVANIFSGNSIPVKKKQLLFTDLSAGTPYVATKDISTDHLINYDNGILIPDAHSDNFKLAPAGSVLICAEGGSAGKKIAHNNRDIHFVNKLFCISPKEDILSKYIFYCLLSNDFKSAFESQLTGLIGGVSLNKFKNLRIPYTNINNQKRIVAILDQAFADIEQARANTEQNLKNARELFESTCSTSIFSLDSIPSCTVFDVAKQDKGAMRTGPFGSQLLKQEIVDEGIAVLGIDNAVQNSFQWGARRFITPEKFEELSRFEVKPGDVLITIMGTCGRCAIVPEGIPKAINTKHICCITLDSNKCLPEYLHAYFLYHPIARAYLFKKAKGAIMAGLNMGIIKELPLVLPSIKVQKELVTKINMLKENIDTLEAVYTSKLLSLDELKKSILQKAFSGELTKTPESQANKGALA